MTGFASLLSASSRSVIDLDATLAVQLVIFGILFLILRSLVFKPVLRLIDERWAQTEGARDEARRMEADAAAKAKRIQQRLHETRVEATAERERMRAEAKKREHEILHRARDEAAALADRARSAMAVERTEAEKQVPARGRELAQLVMRRLLGAGG